MSQWVAHRAVDAARKAGTLVPGPCEVCGSEPTEAHHDDYSRPLDVRWLCRHHHHTHHLLHGPGLFRDEETDRSKKTAAVTVILTEELAERLALLAAQNDRSMSAEARIAIRDRLEQEAAA